MPTYRLFTPGEAAGSQLSSLAVALGGSCVWNSLSPPAGKLVACTQEGGLSIQARSPKNHDLVRVMWSPTPLNWVYVDPHVLHFEFDAFDVSAAPDFLKFFDRCGVRITPTAGWHRVDRGHLWAQLNSLRPLLERFGRASVSVGRAYSTPPSRSAPIQASLPPRQQ
jgi:hypothetical protein